VLSCGVPRGHPTAPVRPDLSTHSLLGENPQPCPNPPLSAAASTDAAPPAAAAATAAVVSLESPVVAAKAIKNAAELEGMKEAHLRDAVAICDFLCWLEEEVRPRGAGLIVHTAWQKENPRVWSFFQRAATGAMHNQCKAGATKVEGFAAHTAASHQAAMVCPAVGCLDISSLRATPSRLPPPAVAGPPAGHNLSVRCLDRSPQPTPLHPRSLPARP
jgi:hypothetical protein